MRPCIWCAQVSVYKAKDTLPVSCPAGRRKPDTPLRELWGGLGRTEKEKEKEKGDGPRRSSTKPARKKGLVCQRDESQRIRMKPSDASELLCFGRPIAPTRICKDFVSVAQSLGLQIHRGRHKAVRYSALLQTLFPPRPPTFSLLLLLLLLLFIFLVHLVCICMIRVHLIGGEVGMGKGLKSSEGDMEREEHGVVQRRAKRRNE